MFFDSHMPTSFVSGGSDGDDDDDDDKCFFSNIIINVN